VLECFRLLSSTVISEKLLGPLCPLDSVHCTTYSNFSVLCYRGGRAVARCASGAGYGGRVGLHYGAWGDQSDTQCGTPPAPARSDHLRMNPRPSVESRVQGIWITLVSCSTAHECQSRHSLVVKALRCYRHNPARCRRPWGDSLVLVTLTVVGLCK
jgi:hypothetical protein